VGRVANRIKNAEFIIPGQRHLHNERASCDTMTYHVGMNDREKNSLHGGDDGYSHRFWEAKEVPNGV